MANYINEMQNNELAEVIDSVNMFELAAKTTAGMNLSNDETAAVEVLDKTFKEIGRRGCDSNNEIAGFISRVINEEMYNAPDELLDQIFDRDSIGENDDYYAVTNPKNTFVAHEAAKGGNVERSYLDISKLTPTWKNFRLRPTSAMPILDVTAGRLLLVLLIMLWLLSPTSSLLRFLV